jgi:hypothetical protein
VLEWKREVDVKALRDSNSWPFLDSISRSKLKHIENAT